MKAITTRYLCPTGRRSSRVKAFDCDGNTAIVYCQADNTEDDHRAAARALCDKLNWNGALACGGLKPGHMVHVFVDLGKTEAVGVFERALAVRREDYGVMQVKIGKRGWSDMYTLKTQAHELEARRIIDACSVMKYRIIDKLKGTVLYGDE